jgi:hypothetical protein
MVVAVLASCKKDNPTLPIVQETVPECDTALVIENTNTIEGYSDHESYFPGDSVHLKIHALSAECTIEVIHHGLTDNTILLETNVPCAAQNYNCRSYTFGCKWNTTYSFKLPESATSGIYSAKLTNDLSEVFYICFVVKGTGTSDFAVIANTNTWQAYNSWGGHSFYRYDLSNEIDRSGLISFDRPNNASKPTGDKGHLTEAELHLNRWMEEFEYDFHTISDRDLHDGIVDLSNYKTLILNVHPEYWTTDMRNALLLFLQEGGNLINLGANGIYWKTVIKGNRIEKKTSNGIFYLKPTETGGRWRDSNLPESAILGVEYDRRGYNTYHPYITKNAEHWVFAGTDLTNGATFGYNCLNGAAASGHETDKMTRHSPIGTIFLAKGSNPNNGGATMCYYAHPFGGQVFSTGSITFTGSLSVDSTCHKIATNVFDAFSE